ncbi:MAG: glycerate kinase [Paludibacter sp.]|nr:glycerate kinase [Paludibacter sp.]
MNAKDCVDQIFRAGVESVLPDKMIHKSLKIENNILSIYDISIPLDKIKRIFVIGAGKASALMAKEVELILGNRITDGHVIVKHGHGCELAKIQVTEAGHPTPDNFGFQATAAIVQLMKNAQKDDLVICLISGGGSSLLADLPEGIGQNDLIELNQLLLKSGADIKEMNTVRKHVSNVKGGQLARIVYPATLVSLILSDVVGDSLEVIASGPTSPDSGTFEEAIRILKKYDLTEKIPQPVLLHLTKGMEGKIPETPKADDPIFENTRNFIIGSNKIALEAAGNKATELGYKTIIMTSELVGDTTKAAKYVVDLALNIQRNIMHQRSVCLLFGGETTLQVTGLGLGGRNQHFALVAACLLLGTKEITLLSAGTDGNDGPTDAAGAIVDGNTCPDALAKNILPQNYLPDFDSYHFFEKTGGHLITGSTRTNVMDLIAILIE